LIVGIAMTLIPGVSLIALLINNLLLKVPLLVRPQGGGLSS